MRGLLLPLSSILSGTSVMVIGVGLLFSVLGLRAGLAEFSSLVTGLIMSAFFVGYILGTMLCPALIHRVGHIRTFAAMASIASMMPLLHAMWIDPWFWGILRLVTGICIVGLYIVIESWLNTLAPSQQRGRIFSVYMSVTFIALAIGQWLILVGDKLGFVPFALVSILLSLALLPITLTPISQPVAVERPRLDLLNLYRISPLGLAGAVVSGLLNGAFYGLGAAYAQGVGFSDVGVATFMAATILGGAAFQWPVGHYSDRHDRRYVMLWVCVVSAGLAALGFVFSLWSENLLIAVGVLYGGFVFTLYGLSVAHVNDLVDSSRLLEVAGSLLLVHGIGAALGPTLAGTIMDWLAPQSLMLFFALILALMAGYTILRIRAAPAVPEEEKSSYVVMTGTAPAMQVDVPTDDADASSSASATTTATEEASAPS
ncbi:MFS transporter [uncultured Oxalicibacterium sp.]|uniref:MFS transporter n=1 Tax=uncultured Oxalicibacterium sp. TaxID=1168540 RepID=UPI0025D42F25|nr:MFS transporter [uncultured Oxalicibacterium sp.]